MSWTVQRYKEQDLHLVSRFFKKVYTGHGFYGSMGLFYWKLIANCHAKGFLNLILDGNTLASTTSITPKNLLLNGTSIPSAEIGDTYTDDSYQRQGMFIQLVNQSRQEAEQTGFEFIYGTPNHQSLPGYQKKANFLPLQQINLRMFIFPLRIRSLLQKRIPWLAADLIDSLFRIVLWFYVTVIRWRAWHSDLSFAEEQKIPADWNDFWKRAAEPFEAIFDRSATAMEWRFFANPNRYHFCTVRSKDGQLQGYVVYRNVEAEGPTRTVLADFLFLPGASSAFRFALAHVTLKALSFEAESFSLWCVKASPYYDLLKRFQLIDRGSIPVICYNNRLFQTLSDCRKWHFTVSDSDNV